MTRTHRIMKRQKITTMHALNKGGEGNVVGRNDNKEVQSGVWCAINWEPVSRWQGASRGTVMKEKASSHWSAMILSTTSD